METEKEAVYPEQEAFNRVILTLAEPWRKQTGDAEVTLESLARDLVKEFQYRRGDMQKAEQRRINARAEARGQKAKCFWCPLNMTLKLDSGTLHLGWQLVNTNKLTKEPAYKYIKSSGGDWDLRGLLGEAKPIERELILEFEMRARWIRQKWRELVEIRRAVRRFTSKALAEEAAAAKRAALDQISNLAVA